MGKRVVKNCKLCNKIIYVYPSRIKDGKGNFCSRKCKYEFQLGKKHTKEHNIKIGLSGIGRKPSKETIEKLKIAKSGKNNAMWKGGITSIRGQIYKHFKTRQWRSDVFTRDDFTCQECNSKGIYLEAHHIKEFCIILKENNIITLEDAVNCEELWNINNGITLCRECHNKTKKGRNTS